MKTFSRSNSVAMKVVGVLTAIALFITIAPFASAQITPPIVGETVPYGESINVDKQVTTPLIPLDPEICFLADTTGSMGPALDNIKNNSELIMNTVVAIQPDVEFCVAQYRDVGDTPLFSVDQDLTSNIGDAQTAIAALTAGGGGDDPEAQLYALHELATGAASFDGPNRIVVWFGDARGHDPSNGIDQATAIATLQAAGITVIAIPIETFASGLDSTGQATAITDATGGILLPGASPDEVAQAIITGLTSLTSDVWFEITTCETGLNVSLSPAVHYDVPGGETVSFSETIAVDNDPNLQGQILGCSVAFYANSYPDGGDLIGTQRIAIRVPDTTAPIAECIETTNPHGKTIPPAGSTTLPGPKGGQNEDGFYQLLAKDEVTGIRGIFINGFGPYAPGDKVKITERKGGEPKALNMGSTQAGNNGKSDEITAHLLLNSDAVMTAYDGAGNTAEATCLVPPPPK